MPNGVEETIEEDVNIIEKLKAMKTTIERTAPTRNSRSLFLREDIKSCITHINSAIEAKAIFITKTDPMKNVQRWQKDNKFK
jgi:hypothetical protein